MAKMNMMEHIIFHCLQVCHVAITISNLLRAKKIKLNRDLIQASALLHDITKTRSFMSGENHAFTGGQLLNDLGFKEVGTIIRQHVRLDNYCFGEPPTEAEIINYSDKRVLHDQIVPLQQRRLYILERYGQTPDRVQHINELWKFIERLEEKLLHSLTIPCEEFDKQLLKTVDYSAEFIVYKKANQLL